jgi:hypothetical protein
MTGRDQGPGGFDGVGLARRLCTEDDPRDHPTHVRVEERNVPLVGERGDGACRVGADAGKLSQFSRIVRKRSTQLISDRPSSTLKVNGTPVVAKSRPNANDVGRRGVGQVLNGWKSL